MIYQTRALAFGQTAAGCLITKRGAIDWPPIFTDYARSGLFL